jgi:colicin import membrane protein
MKNNTDSISFISAFALHLIIGGLLLLSVDFDLPKDKPKESVPVINASIVNQKVFDDLAQRKEDKIREEERVKEEARKQKEYEEAEKLRIEALLKKQAEDLAKAEALLKEKEIQRIEAEKALAAKILQEKKDAEKAAELLKQQQAAEKKALEEKKQADKIKAEKLQAEKLAKEKADKEKAIKEAKVKAEMEAKRKAAEEAERLRLAELDKQMAAEFSDDFSSAMDAKKLSEIAKYQALIRDKISHNWIVDPTMNGSSCTLAIKLAPDGLVISAQMSRGDRRLCDSAQRAAFKAKTLPIPKDPDIAQQFRDFDITLKLEL